MFLFLALASAPEAVAAPPCGPGRVCPAVRDLRSVTGRPPRGPRGGPSGRSGSSDTSDTSDGGDAVVDTTPPPTDADSLDDFANSDDAANLAALMAYLAEEHGIPLEMLAAVAWTESSWNQWDEEHDVVASGTSDYGLMQINKTTWQGEYDWTQIESDVRYNANAGAEILAWAYTYAGSKGYSGTDQVRAAYAVYNGGPSAVDRPWDSSSPYAAHDTNFWNNYSSRPWE